MNIHSWDGLGQKQLTIHWPHTAAQQRNQNRPIFDRTAKTACSSPHAISSPSQSGARRLTMWSNVLPQIDEWRRCASLVYSDSLHVWPYSFGCWHFCWKETVNVKRPLGRIGARILMYELYESYKLQLCFERMRNFIFDCVTLVLNQL